MNKFNTHGGYFSPKGYTKVNEGGSHEENPNGGVQMGVGPDGAPNLLEENEPVYNDFVYSDNINADSVLLEKYNLPADYSGLLYSDIADKILKEAEERPNDPISNNGLNALLVRLANAQEEQKQIAEQKELEEMLASLSPEELEALEAELTQEEVSEQAAMQSQESIAPLVEQKYLDGGLLKPATVTASIPEPNTAAGTEYAYNLVRRIQNGDATLDTIPEKYRNYVEGIIAPGGSMDVSRAIAENGVPIAAPIVEAATMGALGSAGLFRLPSGAGAASVAAKTGAKKAVPTLLKAQAKVAAKKAASEVGHAGTVARFAAKNQARKAAVDLSKTALKDARVLKEVAKDDMKTAYNNYVKALIDNKGVAKAERTLAKRTATYQAQRSAAREAWRQNIGNQIAQKGMSVVNSVNPYASFARVSNPYLAVGAGLGTAGYDLAIPLYGYGMFRGKSSEDTPELSQADLEFLNNNSQMLNFNDEPQVYNSDEDEIAKFESLFGIGGRLYANGSPLAKPAPIMSRTQMDAIHNENKRRAAVNVGGENGDVQLPLGMYASPIANAFTALFNSAQPADQFNIRHAKPHTFYVPGLTLGRQSSEPMDENLLLNQAIAQHNAEMRGVKGLGANQVILAGDNGFIQNIGNPLASVRQQNLAQKAQAIQANNQAKAIENDAIARYGRINAAQEAEADRLNIQNELLQQRLNAEGLQNKYNAVGAPLMAVAQDVSKLARQKMIYDMINGNTALLYGYGEDGKIAKKASKGGLLKKCK